MPQWDTRIDLTDVWPDADVFGDAFIRVRDTVVQRIRQSEWRYPTGTINRLANSADMDDFNRLWTHVYDRADRDRVWLATVI